MVITGIEKLTPRKKGIALFWIVFWAIQSVLMSGGKLVGFYLIKNIAIVGLQLLVVGINVHWLYPRLFAKKKYVAYILLSLLLVYLVFSVSFFFIDKALSFTQISINFSGVRFATDFWIILSGSSFYSLALVCSTLYMLIGDNREKDRLNKRLLQESESVENKYQNLKGSLDNTNCILTIREGSTKHLVPTSDIYYIKGLKEYVVWQTKHNKIIALDSLAGIASRLKSKNFVRVHKSYIINTMHVVAVKSNSIKIGNDVVPIGRAYKTNLSDLG